MCCTYIIFATTFRVRSHTQTLQVAKMHRLYSSRVCVNGLQPRKRQRQTRKQFQNSSFRTSESKQTADENISKVERRNAAIVELVPASDHILLP